jgi:SulP family sulfate permease
VSVRDNWFPKSILSLRGYTLGRFAQDSVAGLTVGMVALPLAMAFGIASGVTPQAGLYTAVVAGFLISALGGSRAQIGGPTGAFVVIVAGIVARFGMSGLALVTVMAGALLIVMGATGLGAAVKFIPRPVIIDFTNGIAVLIASTQIKDFFGLQTPAIPSDFFGRMKMLAECAGTVHWQSLAIALTSLAIILVMPRINRRVPGTILALFLCGLASPFFIFPWKRLEANLAAFRRDSRRFPCHTSAPHTSCHCYPPLSLLLSWRLLRVYSRRSSRME